MSAKHDLGSRSGWIWLVVLLLVLGVVESTGAVLATHLLLPTMGAIVVDVIVVNWTVVAMYVFASPLWGRAEVSADGISVRFGLLGSVRVPIKAILRAAPYEAPARAPLQLGAGFDEDSRQISLVRSTTSESVLVIFRIPLPGRVQVFKSVWASSLVLTTSGAAAFADEINALVLDTNQPV